MKNNILELEKNINLAIIEDNVFERKFPKNIFAICIKYGKDKTFLSIEHDGKTPSMDTERGRSFANDYLSNLEQEMVNNYFINNKKINYSNIFEIMTNNNGKVDYFTHIAN
ncbi:MAG: hypothetical protein U9N85_06800 [Bacteroidota bacterium]|nr:hypothetical protein [Bacteroidota bacterium]